MAGVDAAIGRWDERVAGREVPERFSRALARARELAAQAHDQDSAVAALALALRATDAIRSLSPAHVARRALAHARHTFRTAREAVGDSATEQETASLRRAYQLMNRGVEAFEAKEWRNAVRAALASVKLSQGVIDGRGD